MTQRRLHRDAVQVLYAPTRPALQVSRDAVQVLYQGTYSGRFTNLRIGEYAPVPETASVVKHADLSDAFLGPNSEILSGRESLASNQWREEGPGQYRISLDALDADQSDQGPSAAWISAGITHGLWEITFTTAQPGMGLAFRAANPAALDYWVATTTGLHKMEAGILSAPVLTWQAAPGDRLSVHAQGRAITVSINAIQVGVVSDDFCLGNTYGGPWVDITPPPPPPPEPPPEPPTVEP